MLSINLIPGAINELLATVRDTHCLTKADRYGMMAAILDESTTDEERGCLDRLLRSFAKGQIQVSDDLSLQ
jgi:hypothetical protein